MNNIKVGKGKFILKIKHLKKATLLIFLCLALVACSQLTKRDKGLEKAIYSIVEDSSKHEISLNDTTAFDWEEGFLFTPYSSPDQIEKTLDTKFKDTSHMERRDDIYLLVFLNQGKVVRYAELDRQGAYFGAKEKEPMTPSNDIISIKRE